MVRMGSAMKKKLDFLLRAELWSGLALGPKKLVKPSSQ